MMYLRLVPVALWLVLTLQLLYRQAEQRPEEKYSKSQVAGKPLVQQANNARDQDQNELTAADINRVDDVMSYIVGLRRYSIHDAHHVLRPYSRHDLDNVQKELLVGIDRIDDVGCHNSN